MSAPGAPSHAETQTQLARIWERILRIEPVGASDDFIALGGDWNTALEMALDVRALLGVEMGLREFFTEPTLARLTQLVLTAEKDDSHARPAPPALTPAPQQRFDPFPLTAVQQAYYLGRHPAFELGNVGAQRYIEVEVPNLDLPRYTAAWRALISQHDALRTVVAGDGSQHVLAQAPEYAIGQEDLRDVDRAEHPRRLDAVRSELLSRVFAPQQWPLFEARASLLDERRTRLHIVVDGLLADADSFELLGNQLALAYRGADLPKPEVAFRDYVLWTLGAHDTQRAEADRDYWAQRFATLPPPPQLPLIAEPAAVDKPVFTRRVRRVEEGAWKALRSRAEHAALSPSSLLACAYGQILGAWSKEPRFTLNVPYPARPPVHAALGDVVGDFTALTLLQVDADPRVAFLEQARALQDQMWERLEHRELSGVEVLGDLARHQSRRMSALMPVVFTFRPTDPGSQSGAGWTLDDGDAVYEVSQTPQVYLALEARIESGALVLAWDAVDQMFPAGVLDDMADALTDLLLQLAGTDAPWHDAPREILPARQRHVRAEVNATARPLPHTLLHEAFWDQARRTPDEPAVISETRTLTYRQLRAAAGNLADRLAALGARPNRLVAIVMEKGWQQPLAALGILESGAAYVPVDPDLPAERFQYLLRHAEAEIALVQPHLADTLPWPAGVRVIAVDETLLTGDGAEQPRRIQGQRDLAYVIYTSGSTGLPKGAMIDHRSALNTVLDINRRFNVGAADRTLALTPLSFDLSVFDLFGLLAVGGALVMPDPGTGRAPWHWADLAERHSVTIWNSVPALMEMAAGYTLGRRQRFEDTLRLVLLSGDWIAVSLPDRIRALARSDIEVVSLGGATEAAVWSIVHPIGQVDPAWSSIPYGKPLANQSFHILDEGLRDRPDWVPGEQYIGGYGVAVGYWKDEEKTRRAFITHPTTGERLYRTGDLGRYLPDGTLEFLGRDDFQVKVHGYRIELGEIEAAALSHPLVTGAVVTAIGEARGEKRLVAYVTADSAPEAMDAADRPGTGDLAASLHEHLAEKLPAYMVPAHILVLDAFPLTRNGKLDRKALPDPRTP